MLRYCIKGERATRALRNVLLMSFSRVVDFPPAWLPGQANVSKVQREKHGGGKRRPWFFRVGARLSRTDGNSRDGTQVPRLLRSWHFWLLCPAMYLEGYLLRNVSSKGSTHRSRWLWEFANGWWYMYDPFVPFLRHFRNDFPQIFPKYYWLYSTVCIIRIPNSSIYPICALAKVFDWSLCILTFYGIPLSDLVYSVKALQWIPT